MHNRNRRSGSVLSLLLVTASMASAPLARADGVDAATEQSTTIPELPPAPPAGASASVPENTVWNNFVSDTKAYYTAPLRWSGGDWAWFGVSLAAIGVSYHYDGQVRTHFVQNLSPSSSTKSYDVEDALPTVAVFGLTWLYAGLSHDSDGYRETWAMLEAAGFSGVTAEVLKFAAGRETPYETSDPAAWREGGQSFPSFHTTVAFAVGTVLAESGSDDYRWVRRVLGYGLGVGTAYLRLKQNQHWLSDTVAGAALGISSAHFAMNRREVSEPATGLMLTPLRGGAMLTYTMNLP